MHILHICNDFLGTSAHYSLFRELDELGIKQTIFVPLNPNSDPSKRSIVFKTKGSLLIFSDRLKKYHKFVYGLKILRIANEIASKVNLSAVDIIHSSVMCFEGAVAYELHKSFHIPYITAVRNTDINGYIKYFKWRKPYFKKIAFSASRIVFISSQYPLRFKKCFRLTDNESIANRFIVIHNGLDYLFLNNRHIHERRLQKPYKIVITGAFVQNKNILGLIEAVKILNKEENLFSLSAIGNNLASYSSDEEYAKSVSEKEKEYSWFKTYPAQNRQEILNSLRQYDLFALLSFQETFGLSYLEAISQGLPVIYTKGEGFDGTYVDGFVGYSSVATNPQLIAATLQKAVDNYITLIDNIASLDMEGYKWNNIAKKYYSLYKLILSQ